MLCYAQPPDHACFDAAQKDKEHLTRVLLAQPLAKLIRFAWWFVHTP